MVNAGADFALRDANTDAVAGLVGQIAHAGRGILSSRQQREVVDLAGAMQEVPDPQEREGESNLHEMADVECNNPA